MATMAVMAAVSNSTDIWDYGNRMIHRQDIFGTSTECSLAGVSVNIVSTPSEKLGSTPLEDIVSTPSEDIVSTPSEEILSTHSVELASPPSKEFSQHQHHQDEFGSTSAASGWVLSDFENRSTGGQPTRSTYSMVFG
jgi:hypothetical protein